MDMEDAMQIQAQQGMLVIHHSQGEATELVPIRLLVRTQVRVKFVNP